jgi:hypothetical protein
VDEKTRCKRFLNKNATYNYQLIINGIRDPGVSVVKVLKVRDGSLLDVPFIQFGWDKKEDYHIRFIMVI